MKTISQTLASISALIAGLTLVHPPDLRWRLALWVPKLMAAPADRALWLHTVAAGFDGLDEPTPETLDIITPTFYGETTTCFLAQGVCKVTDKASRGADAL